MDCWDHSQLSRHAAITAANANNRFPRSSPSTLKAADHRSSPKASGGIAFQLNVALLDQAMTTPPWPHAPPHWLTNSGYYFVTASTYHRENLFDSPEKLNAVTKMLIESAEKFGWSLRAWAVFSNHYHFLAQSPEGSGKSLRVWLSEFHRSSAILINQIDKTEGRRIWMNFRESLITHQTSFLSRLKYVNENPVRHGLVDVATEYRWCSAAWFEKCAPESFRKSVWRFKTDRMNIEDDF